MSKNKKRIVTIEIAGGVVQHARCTSKDVELVIIDWDNPCRPDSTIADRYIMKMEEPK